MGNEKKQVVEVGKIGSRKVLLKYDESQSKDMAGIFAKMITKGDAVEYLVRNNLYKSS